MVAHVRKGAASEGRHENSRSGPELRVELGVESGGLAQNGGPSVSKAVFLVAAKLPDGTGSEGVTPSKNGRLGPVV